MSNYSQAINTIYEQRKDIIIGLTGRTGSGCTTVSNILATKKFSQFKLPKFNINDSSPNDYDTIEEQLKSNIIYGYFSNNQHWVPFITIEISSIIFSFIIEDGADKLINYIHKLIDDSKVSTICIPGLQQLEASLKSASIGFNEIKKFDLNKTITENDYKPIIEFYCNELNKYKQTFKTILANYKLYENFPSKFEKKKTYVYDLYIYLMQKFGNNLRKTSDYSQESDNFFPNYVLQNRVVKLINIILEYNHKIKSPTRICIDALRNPFEIHYYRNKFNNFYVFSINVDEDERKRRLNIASEELNNLDKVEYPAYFGSDAELFYHQNIQLCIENADIHLNNKKVKYGELHFIKSQLIKYIALILHPGLITPTKEERCMQIAYNAKLNSGCLSRQVGAAITDEDYSIKAIGWNEVPQNQIPCILRDTPTYCMKNAPQLFSEFEIYDKKFNLAMECLNEHYEKTGEKIFGLKCHYCFKDIFNSLEKNKNQVHTRSLHAEENAFLQITKYGGTAIKGGKLFVTASPCELCSKKSYQLGIKDIYYIDPYPGIAKSNILKSGFLRPQIHLFNGAAGAAYMSLYTPKLAFKDELKYLSGIDPKNVVSEMNNVHTLDYKYDELEYEKITFEMEFISREKIITTNYLEFKPHIPGIKCIDKLYTWTGDSKIIAKIIDQSQKCKFESQEIKNTVTKLSILFDSELKKDEAVNLTIECNVNDKEQIMSPHVSHSVKNITNYLEVALKLPEDCDFIKKDSIVAKTYADLEMKQPVPNNNIDFQKENNLYVLKIEKPNLNYIYCIEWQFNTCN